ncbi:DUF1983 domain-containing protein [Comamonas thiooxydans]|uniref:TipJ family phage tail tip protein n=1 Tax=Comamonas thiooxydans TaxID=363952 RepID=UPI000A2E1F30|nr:phage tail protein [Comamonas thiooxydans]BDR08252.1 DUF1983 domain-containing protein [Comamonas thiooxydans]
MNAFEVVQPRPVRGGWSLRGYKGKGGGGGARQPVEAADSLHSTSYARVLDLLSEGEIAGLVNGLQSVYLNNTPLQNAGGSFNFAGVTADFRSGTQTQDPIPGFPSAESPAAVGVELKAATAWVRSILNRNLSAVRITLGVDGLSKANTENGDISGHTVEYAIDLQTDGGAWVQVLAAAFTGKTTQQYRRTHRIDLPAALSSWTLRVRRITPNANSNTVADTTVIESITEVIDAKLRYPMSALVGLQVDASQFRGSVPTRAYHCRGRIIRVPSNYDPVMRSYAGIWDGTFKSAYSNNPAWVFYDLATNDRYGLGKRIPAGWINKWSLYQIGVYCDGMVSNGRGGVEPRFTCNAYLQSRGDATRVLQDLCSIFRGMVYWAAGAAVPVADMPRDPAVTYSQADVIDGRFSYSGSRLKDRHTVALVSYNDMTDFGRQKVFPYQDDAAVARYGIRKVEISAFGCTSEAQAQRVGQWAVLTAQRETRSVSFSLGLKGTLCSPGQVIEIADSAFAGRRMGGLLKSATAAKVVLDAPVTARAGDSITVMLPSGVAQSRRIAYLEMIDGAQHVSVNPAFDAAPVTESSWAISTADVATQLFTVLSVTEGTGPGLTFDVSAIQHEPGKFAAIDQGALLPERPVSVVPAQVLPTPIGVTVGAHSVTAGDGTVSTTVTAAWQAVAGAAFYDVEWSRSQSDWVRMPRTALTVLDIPNAYTGDYLVRVRAISAIDTVSAWGYSAATTVAAKALPPRNFDTFMVSEAGSGMRQYSFAYTTQKPPADLAGAEIRYILGSPVNIDWQQMRPLDDGGYYTNSFESTKPEAGLWTFALRARSRSGVLSEGMLIWRGQLLHNVADVVPDLTPPPAPAGVTGVPLMTTAQVNWTSPTYTVGHGHDHSVIYAALWATGGAAPAFSAAKSVGTEQGHPASIPVELGSKYTIWVTHVSVDGVESAPSAGVTFVTAQDVGKLLGVLEGKITESQLYTDLAKEIDLISGTGTGSVNARVLAEAQARAQAVAAEANTRAQALAAEASSRAQAVASEAAARGQDVAAMAADLEAATNDLQARIDSVNAQVSDIIGASEFDPAQAYELGQLVKYLNKLYRAKINTVGNLPTNTTYWDLVGDYASLGEAVAAHAAQLADHANRITQTEQGLTAEASARTTLAAQLRGNYTGSDVAQVTSGLVWNERQARVSGDSANASAIDAVKVRMPAGTGKVASEASVIDEATARVAADAAAASRTTVIEARLPAGNGQLATAAAVTALDTRVTSAEGSLTSQSGQITNLQNSLAEAGGQNLLYNPSFDLEGSVAGIAAGFANVRSSGVTANPSLVPSWIDPAGRAQRLDCTGLTTTLFSDIFTDNNFRPAAVEGQRVALSAYVRASAGLTVRVHIQARASQTATAFLATYNGPVVTPGESGARLTLLSSALPAGTTALVILLRVLGSATASAGWVEWDRAQVELGGTVTGWSDNSQARDAATSSALSGLTSRVTAAEGNITSTSGQVTSLSNTLTTTTGTANAAQAAAQAASDLAGGKGKVIYSATAPAVADRQPQNLWIDITGGANTPKRWTGSAWTAVTDKVATDAAAAAAAAQATANTKADASALTALDSKVTSQGNTLAAQGSSITSLKAGLADGSSVNKLANTAFSPEGKQPTTDANGAVAIIARNQLPADVVAGCPASSCAILNLNAGTGSVLRFPFTDSIHATNANRVVGWAPSGGAVDVGCWVFSPASNISAVRLACWYFKEDSSAAGSAAIAGTTYNKTAGGWQYLSGRANVPADAASMTFTVQVLTGAAGDKIYATEPYVAFPNAASMRADGTAEALTSLTARVTAAEGVNTSQSTSITNLQNSVTGLQTGKADASALSALDSKVTTQGNTLNSQGSAITALQNSITNGPVLPSDFSAGLGNWTASRQGDPTTVNTLPGTIVTDDANFGVCAQFNNWTSLGAGVQSKGLVQAVPGRVYRVRARFKVVAAPSFPFGMNIVAGGNTAIFASGGDAFSNSVTITAAGQIAEITALFSDKAANAAGAVAWGATAVLLRFGLRLNTALASGLQLRVQSITIEDATADAANADATTALTSRVTTAEGNITSTSGALTTLTNRVTAAEGVNASQATAISGLQTSVTTINGTLTSQGSAITSLQNSLSSAGGQNLLYNPSFEVPVGGGPDGWTTTGSSGVTRTATTVTSSLDGGAARRIDATGMTTSLYASLEMATTRRVPVVSDQPMAVSAYARGTDGLRAYIVCTWMKSGAVVGSQRVSAYTPLADGWQRLSFVPPVNSGADTFYISLRVNTLGSVTAGFVEWDRAQIELGDVVTGWRDNDKAEASAQASTTQALDSRVTAAEGNITSTSSALTALTNRVTAAEGVNTSQATAISGLNSSVSTINGTLTSQASQITSLQAGLTDAGGQNLLYNSSFELAGAVSGMAEGWVTRGGAGASQPVRSLVPSFLAPSEFAQRLEYTGLATWGELWTDGRSIPLTSKIKVSASVYFRATAGVYARVVIGFLNAQGTWLEERSGGLTADGSMQRILLQNLTPHADAAMAWVGFRVSGTTAAPFTGFVEWDRAQVEFGAAVTGWRDNGVAGLSAVNAAVNTLATASANADAALASRATQLESRMPTGTGQLATAAALTAVDTRVTNIDGRVTSESTRLDQVQAAVGSAAACLQALNPLGGESEWSAVGGAAAATFVTAAEPDARGGAVLTVGNGATNGERWLRHVTTIPMDENKLYKLSVRFRRTAGDGGIYLGIAGLNAAKSLYVNTSNVETSSISAAHYAINNAKPALGTWQVVEYYFKGRAAGAATGSGTKAAPRVFANKVAHLALMIVGNYQGQVGFFDLDYITLEDVTADEQASAAIATEATTRATTDGYLGAQYSVRMQLSQGGQQVVGGFGISGTTSGTAGPQIDFGVMANSFWIAAPSGSPGGVSNVKPFVVQTTAQTINGVVVPAGVYMDAAYINNVTALWARFGNLVADTIQATSISVTKLTGGNLSVGSWINSSNYVTGSTGWSINANGKAEFSDVTVRGTIYSSAGTIGGITINGNGLNSGGFWGYVWPPAGQSGFHIGPNGILLGNANNGRYVEIQSSGNIYAPGLRIENGNATFSGNLSGASGSFSGILTAQKVVTTDNLKTNAATIALGTTSTALIPYIGTATEILGLWVPDADGEAMYMVNWVVLAEAREGAGRIDLQVDGVTQISIDPYRPSAGYVTCSFINMFVGNGQWRYVRLVGVGPGLVVKERTISVLISKR